MDIAGTSKEREYKFIDDENLTKDRLTSAKRGWGHIDDLNK